MQLQRPTKRDQAGFSIIEVLLVVLVVSALAVICFVVYQRHKPSSAMNSAVTSQTQTTTQPTTQYLTIKEWGIKLPLSDSIKDAYYVAGVGSVGTDRVTNQVYLGLTSLNSNGCTAAGSNHGQDSALGMIFRSKLGEVDPVTNKLLTQEYPSGVTIGSYFYGFEGFNNSNISTCKASQTTIQSADSAFATAAKGIVATQPAQTTSQYLDIKEWGVRLTLTSDTASLYYYIKPDLPDVAYLSLKTISDIAPDCAADKVSLGAIVRETPAEQQSAPDAKYSIKGTVHIGNYWYGYDNSHAACYAPTMNAAISRAAPNFNRSTLSNTFNTLVADPATN